MTHKSNPDTASAQIGQLQQLAATVEKCLANPEQADFGTLARAVQMLHGELALMSQSLDMLPADAPGDTSESGEGGAARAEDDRLSLREMAAIAKRAKRMGL
jgi:hypothetical protein